MIPSESIGNGIGWALGGLLMGGFWLIAAGACFWLAWKRRKR